MLPVQAFLGERGDFSFKGSDRLPGGGGIKEGGAANRPGVWGSGSFWGASWLRASSGCYQRQGPIGTQRAGQSRRGPGISASEFSAFVNCPPQLWAKR